MPHRPVDPAGRYANVFQRGVVQGQETPPCPHASKGIARDAEGVVPGLFSTYRYPETYVIDSKGKVVQKIIGAEWTVDNMSRYLKSLL